MKNYNQKIDKFLDGMKHSSPQGDDPIYRIPTIKLFRQYQLESDEPIEELTDNEREYLEIYTENLVFQLGARGVLRGDISKFFLESQYGGTARTKPQDNDVVDYVTFDTEGLLKENTINHEGESLENDAIKDLTNGGQINEQQQKK